jgi:hypothetical protein
MVDRRFLLPRSPATTWLHFASVLHHETHSMRAGSQVENLPNSHFRSRWSRAPEYGLDIDDALVEAANDYFRNEAPGAPHGVFYTVLQRCARHTAGDSPTTLRKQRLKCDWSAKPHSVAIRLSGSRDIVIRFWARVKCATLARSASLIFEWRWTAT